MKRISMTTAILAALFGFANDSKAVNLNPNGFGQVLIYPYYTVQAGQQTLLSVVNTTDVGKAVKVRFLEAYNGREVLVFNLFLSRHDVWTADLFALSDAGLAGNAAAVFTSDNSCTAPALTEGPLSNGLHYQAFLNYEYTGPNDDTGPTTDDRTREGHFEMIAMADVIPASPLDVDISHVNGVPPGCASAEADFEAQTDTAAPTSGLFGAASIVEVNEGTFYAFNAEAIEGFTYVSLNTPAGELQPTLASANDRNGAPTVTSHVFANGDVINSVYPSANAIDAVSSLFVADNLYNEYVATSDGAIGTDWVLTFPTKRFYVDPLLVTSAIPPFEHVFGATDANNGPGLSCATTAVSVLDREENYAAQTNCGFLCPPGPPPPQICLETNVVRFSGTSVLGSMLPVANITALNEGYGQLYFAGGGHDMNPATNGNVFHGLPVTGFAVTRFVNNFVAHPGGGYALANYTAAYRHRLTTSCTGTSGDPCS